MPRATNTYKRLVNTICVIFQGFLLRRFLLFTLHDLMVSSLAANRGPSPLLSA